LLPAVELILLLLALLRLLILFELLAVDAESFFAAAVRLARDDVGGAVWVPPLEVAPRRAEVAATTVESLLKTEDAADGERAIAVGRRERALIRVDVSEGVYGIVRDGEHDGARMTAGGSVVVFDAVTSRPGSARDAKARDRETRIVTTTRLVLPPPLPVEFPLSLSLFCSSLSFLPVPAQRVLNLSCERLRTSSGSGKHRHSTSNLPSKSASFAWHIFGFRTAPFL
jgi:hypothetical protein